MAKRIFSVATFATGAGVADTVNFVNQNYMAIQGGSSTQGNLIWEVELAGQANAAGNINGVFARDSTAGATLTALTTNESDGPINPATAALAAPPVPFTSSTTKPQRLAATGSRLDMSIQGFGGKFRWLAADPSACLQMLGNTASNGEMSLSAYTGTTTGNVGAHIVYEPL